MNLQLWALAFTLLRWPERQKAEAWAQLQQGEEPFLLLKVRPQLEELAGRLPRLRSEAKARGARLLLPGDGEDVDRLLEPLPYPIALWVRGTLPPSHAIALVGSRQASAAGKDRAKRWAKALTKSGLAIISGLARGIDGAAHQGALEAGATWGIMGSGLDHPYPPEHTPLMDRMVEAGGGVITPFPPEAAPQRWHFPRRNLLLAAWSRGVLVMESRQHSGSLVTAKLALDMGKELWVCPGSPEDPLAEGPNELLRQCAARLCRSVEDLLEDLGLGGGPDTVLDKGPAQGRIIPIRGYHVDES